MREGDRLGPLRLHRRQFVLGPERTRGRPDWVHDRLGSVWLSRCPELQARRVADADGVEWWLLGRPLQSDPAGASPAEAVAAARTALVPALRRSWAGRWVLIGGGSLYPDASALLGVLHGRVDGSCWASSSPTLLRQVVDGTLPGAAESPRLFYECGLSWDPPPAAGWPSIRRLLPSQVLRVDRGEVEHAPILPPTVAGDSDDARLAALRSRLAATMRGLCTRIPDPPWLGLTGGFDSRLMLALAVAEGLEVQPFTWLSPRTAPCDRHLPPLLAAEAGTTHRFLEDRGRHPGRTRLIRAHAGTSVSRGDATPLLRGSRSTLEGASFGGHGFALSTGFWRLKELPRDPADPGEAARLLGALFGERSGSKAGAAIREWAEWAFLHPEPGLDWRDRFYLEQRQAGWLAAKEQLFDLAPLERVPLLNAGTTYALILSFDESWRRDFGLQTELIRESAPGLLRFPFNPPPSAFGIRAGLRARATGATGAAQRWARRVRKRLAGG